MSDARFVVAVTGLAFEARIAAGPGARSVAGGGDHGSLEAALERELARGAAAIISFGISGGLVVEATAGTWLVADVVIARNVRWPVDAAWAAALQRQLPGSIRGGVAGADAIIASTAEKRALGLTTGAFAVDMESQVAAAFAARHSLPFAAFRVIADPLTRALAPATFGAMRPDGTVNRRAVLGSLLRQPGQLPLLARNALDTRTAVRALSRGRRLLGPGLGHPDFRQLLVDVA